MRLKRWFALAVLIALAGGCVTSVAPLRADPAKARRACIAVNEATPLAMAREDQAWCGIRCSARANATREYTLCAAGMVSGMRHGRSRHVPHQPQTPVSPVGAATNAEAQSQHEYVEQLASRKIRAFRGTIDEHGEYLDDVYQSNSSLTSNIASDYRDRFLIELIQNAYDAHPVGTRNGRIEITLDMCGGEPARSLSPTEVSHLPKKTSKTSVTLDYRGSRSGSRSATRAWASAVSSRSPTPQEFTPGESMLAVKQLFRVLLSVCWAE